MASCSAVSVTCCGGRALDSLATGPCVLRLAGGERSSGRCGPTSTALAAITSKAAAMQWGLALWMDVDFQLRVRRVSALRSGRGRQKKKKSDFCIWHLRYFFTHVCMRARSALSLALYSARTRQSFHHAASCGGS
eukprot:scaffold6012_cov106-Isochrysis_galbana.AAC.13